MKTIPVPEGFNPPSAVLCPFHEDAHPRLPLQPEGFGFCLGCSRFVSWTRNGDVLEIEEDPEYLTRGRPA